MYDLFDIGTLRGHVSSEALALNIHNEVVGYSSPASYLSSPRRAFHWQAGVMTDLGTLGGAESVAYGINDSGSIVGVSQAKNGEYRAFLWTKAAGMMVEAEPSPSPKSGASAINSAGSIVGWDGQWSPFFRSNAGIVSILSDGSGNAASALGLNEYDDVVGWYGVPDYSHGFFWDKANPTNFILTNEYDVTPRGVNRNRLVVGESGTYAAFAWRPGNPLVQLKGLGLDQWSYAEGINDGNIIVGGSFTVGSGSAVLWFYPSTVATDANSLVQNNNLGMTLDSGRAINGRGSIVGRGTVGGHTHAYLALARLDFTSVLGPIRTSGLNGSVVSVVLGAAGGKVIGVTPGGHVIHFPEPNPILRSVEFANTALEKVGDPEARLKLENEIAAAIQKEIKRQSE